MNLVSAHAHLAWDSFFEKRVLVYSVRCGLSYGETVYALPHIAYDADATPICCLCARVCVCKCDSICEYIANVASFNTIACAETLRTEEGKVHIYVLIYRS